MSDYICFLIWVLDGNQLLECALKLHRSKLPHPEADSYPMEYANSFRELLPLHLKSRGPIVRIEEIYEVHKVKK